MTLSTTNPNVSKATIEQIGQFISELMPKAIKAPWADHPVSSQILADLCLEKDIPLPKLHPSWYCRAQEVRNYLECLLDRFFHEDLEFVSGNILIRREYLPVPNSPGSLFFKPFYSFQRLKKRRVK